MLADFRLRIAVVFLGLLATAGASADDEQPPAARARHQSEKMLRTMRERAAAFRVLSRTGERAEPVELRSEPVFRYSDPPRGFDDAALWCWGEKGRPTALIKVEAARGLADKTPFWQFCVA